jgi:hypothetical protein
VGKALVADGIRTPWSAAAVRLPSAPPEDNAMTNTFSSISQFKKMLSNLDGWLRKGEAYAKAKSFDPNVLLAARLAPDQFPLVRQVQSSCDTAKFAAARLSGKDAPKHPDTEQTVEDLHARLASVDSYLATFTAKDFEGADTRLVKLTFMEGKGLLGSDYLTEMAGPNFFFHVTHTYAILRHNGVDLGKADYLGSLNLRDM